MLPSGCTCQVIRALEEDLGVTLFERTRRKIELTQPGRVLLDQRTAYCRADKLAAAYEAREE